MKAKKLNQKPAVKRTSAQDIELERYLDLELTIKQLTKERDQIKESLRHKGSHSTSSFICLVEPRSRTNPPSLKVLVETYGPGVKDLCTVSEFEIVKVSRKGGE